MRENGKVTIGELAEDEHLHVRHRMRARDKIFGLH